MKAHNICDLLEQKLDVFGGFLGATRELKDIPDFQDNRKGIALLLRERQRCINEIDKIDFRIKAIQRENPSLIEQVPNETRERMTKLAAMIGDIATEAGRITRECEEAFILWHGDMQNQMTHIRQGRKGIHGHAGKAYRIRKPKFFDITL